MNKQQWKARVDVMHYIFSCLFKQEKRQIIIENALTIFNFNATQMKTIETFANHKRDFIALIEKNLNEKWTIDRLKEIDLAILLTAISEFKAHKIDKAIIIDQAVINAKNYSDEKSYAFINAILDKILL